MRVAASVLKGNFVRQNRPRGNRRIAWSVTGLLTALAVAGPAVLGGYSLSRTCSVDTNNDTGAGVASSSGSIAPATSFVTNTTTVTDLITLPPSWTTLVKTDRETEFDTITVAATLPESESRSAESSTSCDTKGA